jgi:hypothetical protein
MRNIRIPEPLLLDAVHIVADKDDLLGQPVMPPEQARPGCIYRPQVEDGSNNHTVVFPEVAVAFGDRDQIRMSHIPVRHCRPLDDLGFPHAL